LIVHDQNPGLREVRDSQSLILSYSHPALGIAISPYSPKTYAV
jgi:hypothetical protein